MDKKNKDMPKEKKKRDIGKLGTRIMAAVLAILMIAAVASTLIYYLLA